MRSVVFMLYGVVMLAGCRVVQPVQHTIEKTDSVIVREKIVPVTVPHSEVTATLSKQQMDSLTLALKSMPANHRTIYMTDPTLKTRLSFTLDSLGKVMIRCESLEAMYIAKLQEKDRYIHIKDLEIREAQKTFGQKVSNYFNSIMWTVGIAFIIIIILSIVLWLKR